MKVKKESFLKTGALAVSCVLWASTSLADEMYPYIAPSNCHAGVSIPENGNDVMFSRNCDYALVLPPAIGRSKFVSFFPSMNLMECGAVAESRETIHLYESLRKENLMRLVKLQQTRPNDPLINKILAENQVIEDSLKGLRTSYAYIEGGRAQVELDGSTPESLMAKWRELNHQMIEAQHTIFVRAPISEGYISYDEVNASTEQREVDPVILKTSIPGFRAPGIQNGTVVMKGAIRGQLVLSLAGACGILKDNTFKKPVDAQIDEEKAASALVANYTYSVPVQSGVEYTAELVLENAIQAILSQRKTAGQFTVENILKTKMEGSSAEICKINIVRYEMAAADPLLQHSFEEDLKGTVCGTLVTRLLNRMQTKGLVEAVNRESAAPTPDQPGGNTSRTAYRRECYTKSVLGIPYDSGCSNVPYEILTWHDGISEKELLLNDETSYVERQSVDIKTVMVRWNTMGFSPSK